MTNIDIRQEFERARQAFRMAAGTALVGTAQENIDRFNDALVEFEHNARRTAFDEGFRLGAQVTQRDHETKLAAFVLDILGKDGADGYIDLGVLGPRLARSRADSPAVG